MNREDRSCPLLDGENIDIDNCYENCLIAEDMLGANYFPQKANDKENAKNICLTCEFHNLD